MRELFGSWGSHLTDMQFAHALLGLGLIPQQMREGGSVRERKDSVRKLLAQNPEAPFEWQVDVLPTCV